VSVTDDLAPWAVANQVKMRRTQARNAELARMALTKLSLLPDDWRRVAEAVAEGGKTWDEIGAALGMTRNQAASCFRRLLVRADLK